MAEGDEFELPVQGLELLDEQLAVLVLKAHFQDLLLALAREAPGLTALTSGIKHNQPSGNRSEATEHHP